MCYRRIGAGYEGKKRPCRRETTTGKRKAEWKAGRRQGQQGGNKHTRRDTTFCLFVGFRESLARQLGEQPLMLLLPGKRLLELPLLQQQPSRQGPRQQTNSQFYGKIPRNCAKKREAKHSSVTAGCQRERKLAASPSWGRQGPEIHDVLRATNDATYTRTHERLERGTCTSAIHEWIPRVSRYPSSVSGLCVSCDIINDEVTYTERLRPCVCTRREATRASKAERGRAEQVQRTRTKHEQAKQAGSNIGEWGGRAQGERGRGRTSEMPDKDTKRHEDKSGKKKKKKRNVRTKR